METLTISQSLLEDISEGIGSKLEKETNREKAADSFIKKLVEDLKELKEDQDHAISLSVQKRSAGEYVNERRYHSVRKGSDGKPLYCAVSNTHFNFQIALLE
ncbi:MULTISPECIES: hypothetical protein [Aquimarina]|uniref:hypothetical protein n=1 Tax=Aquimarina TaxID=290174 RepID=UPI0009433EC7|nr:MULTISPECIES: hypothetical protein [Aquimarina]